MKDWTPDEQRTARDLIKKYVASGMSRDEAIRATAKKLNRGYHGVRCKTTGATRVPESTRQKYNKPLVCKGDALILELHAPYHNAALVNKCVNAALDAGVTNLVLAGDAIDNAMLSSFAPYMGNDDNGLTISGQVENVLLEVVKHLKGAERKKVEEVLDRAAVIVPDEWTEARAVFKELSANFEKVYWMMGNHEDRIARLLNIAFSVSDMARLIEVNNPRFELSSYYWMQVISGGVMWQIEHPNASGKGAGKRVANAQDCNVIMQHNHHFNVTRTASGKYFAIEPGCVADFGAMEYESKRHGGADRHVNGAIMIVGGLPVLLQDGWTW